MGIPAFFSFIIKNYPAIVRNLNYHNDNHTNFDNLLMDCNSIVYDVYNSITKDKDRPSVGLYEFESVVIQRVIEKIEYYIDKIGPTNTLFIAFDGVAPFAKMEQQRTRRYKSNFMSTIGSQGPSIWNTTAITPGTAFMKRLSKEIEVAFKDKENIYKVKKIVVSCSNEPGEGEHKLFQYVRKNPAMSNENIFVYGLDSDLIMLSIFHCDLCKNIFVFREAPDFIKSVGNLTFKLNDLLFLDVGCLSKHILIEMACDSAEKHRIYDYIFICFLLGNDFLPHFPALNIRTHGIHIILNTYRKFIGNFPQRFFISIDNRVIQWKWVKLFFTELSKNEQEYMLGEYVARNKMDKYQWSYSSKDEQENVILNTPVIYRTDEKYICPSEKGWQDRYYRSLFSCERTHANLEKICTNYMEGLEWVFKYYTDECPDWKWKYNYHYAPLLVDLCRFIPEQNKDFIYSGYATNRPFPSFIQLLYVVPPRNHYLIGDSLVEFIRTHYTNLFKDDIEFKWAFCRYFWESHVILQDISVDTLEKIGKEYTYWCKENKID
jgi:5'-3' exonuclease